MLKRGLSLLLCLTFCLTGFGFAHLSASAAAATACAGQVSTANGKLNVRGAASLSAPVVRTLKKGATVALLSRSGDWWRVEYGDRKYGYCHADYIKPLAGVVVRTIYAKAGQATVRSGAGKRYSAAATLANGTTVRVLSATASWSRVLYHGVKTGYVKNGYLSKFSQVSLAVPSFKQTDPRWASVLIGTSGKTIGKIGCTTTSIAMIESYRTGGTIDPDAMMQRLSYSASGDLYWPTDYHAVTVQDGYLAAIYNQLHAGKPVLLGVKKDTGKQHWVVVNGFTGGKKRTAGRFTILDPGSATRTTVKALLADYPQFYKFLYYTD